MIGCEGEHLLSVAKDFRFTYSSKARDPFLCCQRYLVPQSRLIIETQGFIIYSRLFCAGKTTINAAKQMCWASMVVVDGAYFSVIPIAKKIYKQGIVSWASNSISIS